VELVERSCSPSAEGLLGRHLQQARLDRDADRRECDAVVGAEIGDGLDLGVRGGEEVGQGDQGRHALDVDRAPGPVPNGQERGDAARRDVDIAREQRLVDRGPPEKRAIRR
jgi:hypothetical protein